MTAAVRDRWVVCDEFAAGPFTPAGADRKRAEIEERASAGDPHACLLGHQIVTSTTAPVPRWKKALEGDER